jgi:hypothetical protein
MDKFLNGLRIVANSLAVFFLALLTFAAIIVITITSNLTQRDTVKHWVDDAGLYDNAVDGLLILASEEANNSNDEPDNPVDKTDDSGSDEEESVPIEVALGQDILSAEQVEKVLHDVISPEFLQQQFEGLLDGGYNWLEGKSSEPIFEFDLSSRTDVLINSLTEEVMAQSLQLPACSPSQITQNFDPFNAVCLPPGVNADVIASTFKLQLGDEGNEGIPTEDLNFTNEDIDFNQEDLDKIPPVYALAQQLPSLFGIVIFVLMASVLLTSKTIMRGIRKNGVVLLVVGLVSWIGWYILSRFIKSFDVPADDIPQELVDKILRPIIDTFSGAIVSTGSRISVVVTISGVLLWLTYFLWHRAHPQVEPDDSLNISGNNKEKPKLVPNSEASKSKKEKSIKDK